jgi:WD40 repeat protein
MIAADGPSGSAIYDATTGEVRDLFTVDEDIAVPLGTSFSDDGRLLIIGTKGRYTAVFDVATGERLFRLPGGQVNNPVYDIDAERLFTAHDDGTVKVWDLSSDAVGITSAGDVAASFIARNRLRVGPNLGAFISFDFATETPYVQFFGLDDGVLLDETLNGWLAFPLADGRWVYESLEGPWAFYDPATGDTQPFLGCVIQPDGTCSDTDEPAATNFLRVSGDGKEMVAVTSTDGAVTDGTLHRLSLEDGSVIGEEAITPGFFFADAVGEGWIVVGNSDQLIALDRTTGERLWFGKVPIGGEFSPSGRLLVFPTEGTGLRIVDTTTWTETAVDEDFGNVRGISFNQDETKVALGNTDRLIIFDLAELVTAQVLEIPAVQSMYWIDDETLAIGTDSGVWGTVSLSTEDLIGEIRFELRRSFTASECATYRIDPCPTLEEIRSR